MRTIVAALVLLWGGLFGIVQAAEQASGMTAPVPAEAPLAQRLPDHPRVIDLGGMNRTAGKPGGTWRLLMGDQRDLRMITVYSYARLVVFDEKLDLQPDILESLDVRDDKAFTLHLRPGHKWSDGQPFTSEDFRYFWEDVANNPKLYPSGPPAALLANKQPPRFEVLDPLTVRYTWEAPNPGFLPALAAAQPVFIFMPAHYLKQFHGRYADKAALASAVKAAHVKDWSALHERKSRQYRPENPDLPTLDPWMNTTAPPAELFVFKRNPFFHRVDEKGQQLPYFDRVEMSLGTTNLIPAKAASGSTDLQARYLNFEDYTFLKQAENNNDYKVHLWERGEGAYTALMPNLNTTDEVWRKLWRDVRVRRALSIGINRRDLNRVIFFGLARESSNTVLPQSPLYQQAYADAWASYDPVEANRLLDAAGLDKRDAEGFRLLPDGRRADIIVDTAGASTEDADVIELVNDDWIKLGIRCFNHPSQRDVFRLRIQNGAAIMSIGPGLDNGVPSADFEPDGLAPVHESQFQWPRWGLHWESDGHEGDPIDIPEAQQLLDYYRQWRRSTNIEERRAIWHKMLSIYADQVFTIGIVNGTQQPIVVNEAMRNVPDKALYAFEPGSFFGMYMPDTFWYDVKTD